MATDSLSGALIDACKLDPTLAAYFTGGFWLDEVPAEKPNPAAAVLVEGESVDWLTGPAVIEHARVTLAAYGAPDDEAERGARMLMAKFDTQPPPIALATSGNAVMAFLRQTPDTLSAEELTDSDGQTVFKCQVVYAAMVQRMR